MEKTTVTVVRRMTRHDLEAVLAIEKEVFTLPWTPGMFEREIIMPISRFYVLLAGDELAGYAGFWKVMGEAHILNFAIAPAHRRKGYGRRLLAALLDAARAETMRRAVLEVRASNAAALTLYGACGFRRLGVRPGYYPDNDEDAVIMGLEPL